MVVTEKEVNEFTRRLTLKLKELLSKHNIFIQGYATVPVATFTETYYSTMLFLVKDVDELLMVDLEIYESGIVKLREVSLRKLVSSKLTPFELFNAISATFHIKTCKINEEICKQLSNECIVKLSEVIVNYVVNVDKFWKMCKQIFETTRNGIAYTNTQLLSEMLKMYTIDEVLKNKKLFKIVIAQVLALQLLF